MEPSTPQTAATLRHLLDETADLIDSPTFTRVQMLLNNECFETLIQQCKVDAFKSAGPVTAPQSFASVATVVPFTEDSQLKTKLANVLAVLARQAHVIGNGTAPPNLYVTAMDQGVRELEAFAAVVYSSNFDFELLGAGSISESSGVATREPDSASSSPVIVSQGGDESDYGQLADSTPVVASADDGAFDQAWGRAVEEQPTSEPTA
jgi:peroxin-3